MTAPPHSTTVVPVRATRGMDGGVISILVSDPSKNIQNRITLSGAGSTSSPTHVSRWAPTTGLATYQS